MERNEEVANNKFSNSCMCVCVGLTQATPCFVIISPTIFPFEPEWGKK